MYSEKDYFAYRARQTLKHHGYSVELTETDQRIRAALRAAALHLNVALLAESEEQARNWKSVLAPAVQQNGHLRSDNASITLHTQSWDAPLTGRYDEIHVIDANSLSTERIEQLTQQTTLLSLHVFSDWPNLPEGQHWSSWASTETLALYLKNLLGTLNNQAYCCFSWEDYLQLKQSRSNSTGVLISAVDWRHALDELMLKTKTWPDTTSILIFLNIQPDFTFGEYAEIDDLLHKHLAGRCLLSISSANSSQTETTLPALPLGQQVDKSPYANDFSLKCLAVWIDHC